MLFSSSLYIQVDKYALLIYSIDVIWLKFHVIWFKFSFYIYIYICHYYSSSTIQYKLKNKKKHKYCQFIYKVIKLKGRERERENIKLIIQLIFGHIHAIRLIKFSWKKKTRFVNFWFRKRSGALSVSIKSFSFVKKTNKKKWAVESN